MKKYYMKYENMPSVSTQTFLRIFWSVYLKSFYKFSYKVPFQQCLSHLCLLATYLLILQSFSSKWLHDSIVYNILHHLYPSACKNLWLDHIALDHCVY